MKRFLSLAADAIGPLHMGWRHVLFANWPVPPAVVEPHVPDALQVDTYDGAAWLSVVPFTNVDVRPTWAPDGWGFPLPELNLRTYVSHHGTPGVYFFSLDATGILGVLGARLFHSLPYYLADISIEVDDEDVLFHSVRSHPGARPARYRGSYRPTGAEFQATPGSIESFLVDRYRYYTEDQESAVRYAVVDHEPWPLYDAEVSTSENTLFVANGFEQPETDPVYLYSPGVETTASVSKRP